VFAWVLGCEPEPPALLDDAGEYSFQFLRPPWSCIVTVPDELGLGSGNVDRLCTEERGVEGRGDSCSPSKEGMFNERVSCHAEVAVELRTDPASWTVPIDSFLRGNVGFSRE
jgi:hypothetical protein